MCLTNKRSQPSSSACDLEGGRRRAFTEQVPSEANSQSLTGLQTTPLPLLLCGQHTEMNLVVPIYYSSFQRWDLRRTEPLRPPLLRYPTWQGGYPTVSQRAIWANYTHEVWFALPLGPLAHSSHSARQQLHRPPLRISSTVCTRSLRDMALPAALLPKFSHVPLATH